MEVTFSLNSERVSIVFFNSKFNILLMGIEPTYSSGANQMLVAQEKQDARHN